MGGGSSKTKKVDPALNSVLPPSASTALPNVPEPESKPKNSWHHILSYDPTYLVEFPPTGSFGIELMSPIPGDQRVYVKKLIPDGFAVRKSKLSFVILYLYYVYYLFISLAAFIYSGEPAPYFFLTCASFALPFNGGAFGFFGFDDLDADGLFFVLLFD